MLTEDDVVGAVSRYLEASGYEVPQRLTTHQKGVDIIASKDGVELHIEAKGATSSKSGTTRFGKPFDRAQVLSHVSRALFECAKTASDGDGATLAALALPDDALHRERVGQVEDS